MQGRNRDTDVENGRVDTEGEGGGRMNWEIRIDVYTLPCVKLIASGKLLHSTGRSARCSVMTRWVGWGVGERSKREGIYVYI